MLSSCKLLSPYLLGAELTIGTYGTDFPSCLLFAVFNSSLWFHITPQNYSNQLHSPGYALCVASVHNSYSSVEIHTDQQLM